MLRNNIYCADTLLSQKCIISTQHNREKTENVKLSVKDTLLCEVVVRAHTFYISLYIELPRLWKMSTKDAGETSAKGACDFEEVSGTANHPVPTETMIQSFSNLSIATERPDILLLASKIPDFERLVELLKSTKRYICRSDRNLMVRALLFYQRRQHKDQWVLISALRGSTKHYLSMDLRNSIAEIIDDMVSKYSSELVNARPENDDELFGTMIDENSIKQDVWEYFQSVGVVSCYILPSGKKIELVGIKPSEEFYVELAARWKFDRPTKYLDYTGGASIPVGKLDAADVYVTAGTALESIGELIDGCDIQNGTVGGLFCCDETMCMVTAGHCVVTNCVSPSAETTSIDDASSSVVSCEDAVANQTYWIERSDRVDVAILPFKKLPNGILGFNPW
jgi:hypothetical protein